MDTLHNVMRSIRGEQKSQPSHITVFREFLDHLERINKQKRAPAAKRSKPGGRRGRKR